MNGKNYDSGKENEHNSWDIMEKKGFYRPKTEKKSKERANIAMAYSMLGKNIEPRGFDLVDIKYKAALDDPNKISALILEGKFVLYELKTAGAGRRTPLKENFNGLGFTLTENEKHNHSVLGDDGYKFIFLDLKTNECICVNYLDWHANCRIYATWSVFVNKEILSGVSL